MCEQKISGTAGLDTNAKLHLPLEFKSHLPDEWFTHLEPEFNKDYMKALLSFLSSEVERGAIVYPENENIFCALKATPLNMVKVVIIGQDPYHGPGQAHGLSFSVRSGVKTPPSLKNIFKEISSNFSEPIRENGYLIDWAKDGVLLLNSVLTVEATKAGSHQKKGWEKFTDKIVEVINNELDNVVFLLWGKHAHKKGSNIDPKKHLILKSVHPSPLSAHRGFFGCEHFKRTNKFLESVGKSPVKWS